MKIQDIKNFIFNEPSKTDGSEFPQTIRIPLSNTQIDGSEEILSLEKSYFGDFHFSSHPIDYNSFSVEEDVDCLDQYMSGNFTSFLPIHRPITEDINDDFITILDNFINNNNAKVELPSDFGLKLDKDKATADLIMISKIIVNSKLFCCIDGGCGRFLGPQTANPRLLL